MLWFKTFEAYLDWNQKMSGTKTVKEWRHLLDNCLDADLASTLSTDDTITEITVARHVSESSSFKTRGRGFRSRR